MFDGKVGKMDSTERAIEAQLAAFRDAIEIASASDAPQLQHPATLWRRALGPVSEFLGLLIALAATGGLIYGLALLARLGWETGA